MADGLRLRRRTGGATKERPGRRSGREQSCTVEGCEGEARAARGLCWKHYRRWLRNGEVGGARDEEQYREVPVEERCRECQLRPREREWRSGRKDGRKDGYRLRGRCERCRKGAKSGRHGSEKRYDAGCRCEVCRAEQAERELDELTALGR